jgi:SAM-dependent methyltransferase
MTTPSDRPDFAAITTRQQQTWATGDFNVLALTILPVSEALVTSVDPHAGQRVLDVACGSGNTALVAARRYCQVTGVDYVPALLERARQRAAAEGVQAEFRAGDAQALPFPDAAFDVVLSTFGVMFAPDQEKAAAELLRVCAPGGRIGLATWMPEGYGGDFFKVIAKYVPPPPGLKPPLRWGTEAGLRELLGAGTNTIHTERRLCPMYFRSVAHAVDVFQTHFGPIVRACQTLDAAAKAAMLADVSAVISRYNRASDGTLILGAEYVQVLATRKVIDYRVNAARRG